MKTILVGKLIDVQEIEVKNNHSQQRANIFIQEFDHSTGEKKDPQIFPFMIFNKKIKECDAKSFEGKKVKVTCWLRSLASTKEDKTFYNIALNATSIEIFE